MALINCPECKKEISDKAASCPNCGCPINKQSNNSEKEYLCCPKCHSKELHSESKGFSGGKALVGAAFAGGVGLLAGTIGSKDVQITCLKCGHKFKPGKGGQTVQQNTPSQQVIREFESHVIKPGESEKTQMYRCDCGKESCLPIGSSVCPKCGRRLNDNHRFIPTHKSGCASVVLLFILSSAFIMFLL